MRYALLFLWLSSTAWGGCYRIATDPDETVLPMSDSKQSECKMKTADIALAGTVRYPGYRGGKIALFIGEEVSEMCGDSEDTRWLIHPGYEIGEIALDTPGPFETTVTVSHVEGESLPELTIVAVYAPDNPATCEAGQLSLVAAKDDGTLDIELEPGLCPMLL